MKRALSLGGDDTVLPKGTRVVVVVGAVDERGERHRPGAIAVVRHVDGAMYVVETPAGAVLHVERSALKLERADVLAELTRRQWDERRLREHVIYAAVVGSKAWGLDDENSDEDVRGCFVLPFEEHASLFDAPDEIHDEGQQSAYWEIEKLIRQALRADPNTLETLWSPLVKTVTPLGQKLVDGRTMFSSQRVVQSFGRYAQSQLDKLARTAARATSTTTILHAIERGRVSSASEAQRLLPPQEDVHAVIRSLFDRGLLSSSSFAALVDAVRALGPDRLAPEEVRPKNAYNLVRLLASCLHWLEHGEPLIRVADPALRAELLAIKRSDVALDKTLERARELAKLVDERAQHPSPKLPLEPDVDAADALLREARRAMARVALPVGAPVGTAIARDVSSASRDLFVRRWFPDALPSDVDTAATKRFLEGKLADTSVVVVALTGAHAYGFPSPDSDLDLKAIHAAPASRLLGLKSAPAPIEVLELFEGREMDLSSHEIGMAAGLLLKGNGNMLERLLGPMTLVVTPAGEELAAIAKRALSKRVVHHYRGFLQAMKRESDIELRDKGRRTAKRMLYAYRVAFTGAHLLLAGELVTDVRALSPEYSTVSNIYGKRVEELVERKRSGEFSTLSDDESAPYLKDIATLDDVLSDALQRSILPDEPNDDVISELDALMVSMRMAAGL